MTFRLSASALLPAELCQQLFFSDTRDLKAPSLALQSAIFRAMVVSMSLGDYLLTSEGEIFDFFFIATC